MRRDTLLSSMFYCIWICAHFSIYTFMHYFSWSVLYSPKQ